MNYSECMGRFGSRFFIGILYFILNFTAPSCVFALNSNSFLQNDVLPRKNIQSVLDSLPHIQQYSFTVPNYEIIPIYIIASDQTENPQYTIAINDALSEIQKWYERELDGQTFLYHTTTVKHSTQPISYFQCQIIDTLCTRIGNLKWNATITETLNLGFPVYADPKQIHLVFVDAGGSTALGGMSSQNDYSSDSHGVAILDSWNLEGIANLFPNGPHSQECLTAMGNNPEVCGINAQRGVVAHEFGHTLSLPHPFDHGEPQECINNNLMAYDWWKFPSNQLSSLTPCPQKQTLKTSPFFFPPTTPTPTTPPTPTRTPTPIPSPTLTITPTSPPNCITPTDKMLVTESVTLCPGTYNLPGDASGALRLMTNNITIEGTGVTLVGNNMDQFGIRGSNLRNVTIKGITVKNYHIGIDIDQSENVQIISSNLTDNHKITIPPSFFSNINISYENAYGGGIRFYACNNCLIKNTVANNNSVGIDWYYVTNSTIVDSSASFGNIWGVHLYGSTGNLIKRNQIHHNICNVSNCWGSADSAGLLLVMGSNNNKIYANNLQFSGDGFFIGNEGGNPSNNNVLIGNDGSFAHANAFETTFSDGNYYEGNYATRSSYGFWLGFSYNMTLYGNIASNNNNQGIDIEHGRNNQIFKNIATNNYGAGIKLHLDPHNGLIPRYPGSEHSQNNSIISNSLFKNTFGVNFTMNRNSNVSGNLLLDNSLGFYTSGDHPEETGGNHVNNNSLSCNPQNQTCGPYAVNSNDSQIDTDFTQDYWGTINENEIRAKIADQTQTPTYGKILYNPFATVPINLTLPVLLIKYQNMLRSTGSVIHIPQTIHPNCNTVSAKNKGRWTTYVWDFKDLPYNLTTYDLAFLKCQTPRTL